MSVINSDSMRAGASGDVSVAYVIEQSCRFNKPDSTYSHRTESDSPTSTTVYTISVWVKRSVFGVIQHICDGRKNAGGNQDYIGFDASDKLRVFCDQAGGGSDWGYTTKAVYRDPSAWMPSSS